MDDPFRKISTSTLAPSLRQRCQHFAHIIAGVEFALRLDDDHDNERHVFGSNRDRFPIRNFSMRRQPYKVMICNVIAPGLIKGHDVVPGSGALPGVPSDGIGNG
jgi:hypothetical protein